MTAGATQRWSYAPGAGLLLGTGDRWLLVADQPEECVIRDLWEALTGLGLDQALAVVERAYAGRPPSVAAWDVGRCQVRGGGAVAHGAGPELTVGLDLDGPWLPLAGGIVAGAAVRLEPADAPVGRRRLIDGIPEEVAASVGPDVPTGLRRRPDQPAAEPPEEGAEHDGRTTHRQSATVVRTSRVDHLRQPTSETVLAVFCAHGHPTPAYSGTCRVCRGEVASQQPQRIPRPRLGGLRLPSGEVVALDRSVVIGRRPAPVDDQGEWPHLVSVPPEASYVSRVHVHLEIDGWLVVARDLGSRGGTTLLVPGRAPEAIRAQEPHVLEPGHALDLADEFLVVYEVGDDPSRSGDAT
ncbi:FHA domain-containing protein [Nocardioides cynanchi]|uniref:FHA domain-containing protein n=1 Tax=Nocardioides cynanchi TaxID=2558918 RepID=UPI00177FEBC0|nr:FHA domain-containing protein [Nocardioides cynanchi]